MPVFFNFPPLPNEIHKELWCHSFLDRKSLKNNRRWHISTTLNTTNFFTIFKLTLQSNMITLSCLTKKNQNLDSRWKSSVYYWRRRFVAWNGLKTQLLVTKADITKFWDESLLWFFSWSYEIYFEANIILKLKKNPLQFFIFFDFAERKK